LSAIRLIRTISSTPHGIDELLITSYNPGGAGL
jgi:hypothetical protein